MSKIKGYNDQKIHHNFDIHLNAEGNMTSLVNTDDPHQMNWIRPDSEWGKVDLIPGISVKIERHIKSNKLTESYTFVNDTNFDIYAINTQLGITVPFADYYTDADIALNNCSNTHIWCGQSSSYIMGLRMGGKAPNLGLILKEGSLKGYSLNLDYDPDFATGTQSNDRGGIIVHPENIIFHPHEEYNISWDIVWFQDKQDFKDILRNYPNYVEVISDNFVVLEDEPISFELNINEKVNLDNFKVKEGNRDVNVVANEHKIFVKEENPMLGQHEYTILYGNYSSQVVFNVKPSLDELMEARVHFITKHQQVDDQKSYLNGCYVIFDNEDQIQYYGHQNDYNGSRERIAMAILVAHYLISHDENKIKQSLIKYMNYFEKELFDSSTGELFNDAPRNNDEPRLYNYPWAGQLFLELFSLTQDKKYLSWYVKLMFKFYQNGGYTFYGIGIPMSESIKLFKEAGLVSEADELIVKYKKHVDTLVKIGKAYPKSEVDYEQSIVAPAATYMADMFEITKEYKYKQAGLEQVKIMDLFQDNQPDFHLNETAIRHWDDYWFGKNKMFGDTFPHYWTALSGLSYLKTAKGHENNQLLDKARKSLRSSLSLFSTDGSASCAYVYPMKVNRRKGQFYDPWANDQDWGLYFAIKYRQFVETDKIKESNTSGRTLLK